MAMGFNLSANTSLQVKRKLPTFQDSWLYHIIYEESIKSLADNQPWQFTTKALDYKELDQKTKQMLE